jgi:hypothetical protein
MAHVYERHCRGNISRMTTLHRLAKILNLSQKTAHLMFLSEHDDQSRDVLLLHDIHNYVFGAPGGSAPIPECTAANFETNHLRLRLGMQTRALYAFDGGIRVSPDANFHPDAPRLPGYAGPAPLELTIAQDGSLRGAKAKIDGPLASSAFSIPGHRYAVFTVAGANSKGYLLERSRDNGQWYPWTSLGVPESTTLAGPVAACFWTTDHIGVYALGQNGDLCEWVRTPREWAQGRWYTQKPPTGKTLVDLCAVSWFSFQHAIYATALDGHVHERWKSAGTWNDWQDLGCPSPTVSFVGPITAVSGYIANWYAVYALANDGNVYEKSTRGGPFNEWNNIGTPVPGLTSIAAVSAEFNEVHLVGVTADGRFASRRWSSGWEDWTVESALGHTTLRGPITALYAEKSKTYFAEANDGYMWKYDDDDGWQPFT